MVASALNWVRDELDNLFVEVQDALRRYADDTSCQDCLTEASDRIEQIRGTLMMVQMDSVVLICDEFLEVVETLRGNNDEATPAATEALLRAALQVPAYLEQGASGVLPSPLVLFPLLNELRAARGASLLMDVSALMPDPQQVPGAINGSGAEAPPPGARVAVLKEARRKFQRVLLQFMRGDDPAPAAEKLRPIVQTVEQNVPAGDVRLLFWIAAALLEGLGNGGIEASTDLRRVVGRIDRELGRYLTGLARHVEATADGSEPVYAPSPDLIKALLFHVACAETDGEQIAAVRAVFGLPAPDADSGGGVGREVYDNLRRALEDDLADVRERLDVLLRTPSRGAEDLAALREQVERIGSTFSVLGLEAGERHTGALAECLVPEKAGEADEQVDMSLAEHLLALESLLDSGLRKPAAGSSQKGDVDRHLAAAVYREALLDLRRARETLLGYMAEASSGPGLEQARGILVRVEGAMSVGGFETVQSLLKPLVGYLDRRAAGDVPPMGTDESDALAEVLSSIEVALESSGQPWRELGSVQQRGLEALERLDALAAAAAAAPAPAPADTTPQAPAEPTPSAASEAAAESPAAASPVAPQVPESPEPPPTAGPAPAAAPVAQPAPRPAAPQGAGGGGSAGLTFDDAVLAEQVRGPDIDPEILEVFLEEADEAITTLRGHFPQWQLNPGDFDALTVIRRAFHTLKGSGRLAGALRLGEFSWAVESFLNRLLDGETQADHATVQAIEDAIGVLPALVAEVRDDTGPDTPVLDIALRLQALVAGGSEAEATSTPAPAAPAPDEAFDDLARSLDALDAPAPSATPEPPVEAAAPESDGLAFDLDSPAASEPDPQAASAPPVADEPSLAGLELDDGGPGFDEPFTGAEGPGPVGAESDFAFADLPPLQTPSEPAAPAASGGSAATDGPTTPVEGEEPEAGPVVPDPQIWQVFSAEAVTHLLTLRNWTEEGRWRPHRVPSHELERALHTLNGSARTASVVGVHAVCGPFERLVSIYREAGQALPARVNELLDELVAYIESAVTDVQPDPAKVSEPPAWATELDALVSAAVADQPRQPAPADVGSPAAADAGGDTIQLDDFPLPDNGDDATELPADPDVDEAPAAPLEAAQGGDPAADAGDDRPDAFALDRFPFDEAPAFDGAAPHEDAAGGHAQQAEPAAPDSGTLADFAWDEALVPAAEAPSGTEAPPADDRLVIDDFAVEPAPEAAADVTPVAADSNVQDDFSPDAAPAQEPVSPAAAPAETPAPADVAAEPAPGAGLAPAQAEAAVEELDLEFAAVFIEEARDILESAFNALAAWREAGGHPGPDQDAFQREVHTLKGSARMAGFQVVGAVAHAIESALSVETESGMEPREAFFEVTERALSDVQQLVERGIGPWQMDESSSQSLPALRRWTVGDDAEEAAAPGPDAEQAPSAATLVDEPAQEPAAVPAQEKDAEPAAERGRIQEQVRMDADVLDSLVNNAGELATFHRRFEQTVGRVEGQVEELERTIARLRDQLRKLEIETEAQILFRVEEESGGEAVDFDPLEMDRYSGIQQLSRALAESVSDLESLKDEVGGELQSAGSVLLQQRRVGTDLQDQLMRQRMVRFARMAPRLRRVVRQAGQDLGKDVHVDFYGQGAEMDRALLERLVAPLEHLLRNAIAHGIEDPETRQRSRKPVGGQIAVALEQSGSEIRLQVSDDGAGIDADAVRARAVERGLIPATAALSDSQALQLILQSGFSTASEVSQVAGRGVGLDVVNSDVKQLGGTLEIASTPGRGSRFTMRLPFTLAISQALLVQVGEQTFAVPMASVEGVVRARTDEIDRQHGQPHYHYAGQDYQVGSLGELMGVDTQAGTSEFPEDSFPLLLVRTDDKGVALRIDELLGSQEVVVKSVGPVLSRIPGVAGATLQGDGSVMLILDLSMLVRFAETSAAAAADSGLAAPAHPEQAATRIMVVDDSITIRKVTARLLTRQGYEVITARDGLDAVGLLDERRPHLILLDVEMPRMDGFEFAAHVREHPELGSVPIIMITSRSGAKHRERAARLGVNSYLGKPYLENDLLEEIQQQLEAVPA